MEVYRNHVIYAFPANEKLIKVNRKYKSHRQVPTQYGGSNVLEVQISIMLQRKLSAKHPKTT